MPQTVTSKLATTHCVQSTELQRGQGGQMSDGTPHSHSAIQGGSRSEFPGYFVFAQHVIDYLKRSSVRLILCVGIAMGAWVQFQSAVHKGPDFVYRNNVGKAQSFVFGVGVPISDNANNYENLLRQMVNRPVVGEPYGKHPPQVQ